MLDFFFDLLVYSVSLHIRITLRKESLYILSGLIVYISTK